LVYALYSRTFHARFSSWGESRRQALEQWFPKFPKVGGTATLEAVRNSRGAVKQKWAIGGR